MSTIANPTPFSPSRLSSNFIHQSGGILPAGKHPDTASAWGNFDFIDAYADYADIAEIPREAHEAVGCQIIASILNKNAVLIPHGGNTYMLDFWQILITKSGGGRSSLLRGVKSILKNAGLQTLLKDSHWGSEPAAYQYFSENPHSMFLWGEFSEMLGRMNNLGDLKGWLIDRYDDTDPPNNRTYRQTGSGKNTPPIIFLDPHRTNIVATSSDGWFFKNMNTDDSSGGFLPRWTLNRLGVRRDVSTPSAFDLRKQSVLIEYLKRIDGIRGNADISRILPYYDNEAWYVPTKKRFESQTGSTLGEAYFNRHRVHVFKLAVIYEVARSGSMVVSREAWERAIATARRLEKILFDLLGTGMSERGWEISSVEEKIRNAGPGGIRQWKLNRMFRGTKDLEKHKKVLVDEGTIRPVELQTGGRTATVYLHQDHYAAAGLR
jgi:hypothetical protein